MRLMVRLGDLYRGLTDTVRDPFSTDTTGLPDATGTESVALEDGGRLDLKAGPVRKRLGDAVVRMLAYNGSIPGPTLRVAQGSAATIAFTNEADVETTVHWHGLRLDNRYDGVPDGHHRGMQAPVPVGGAFTHRLRFSDPGLYWYHPHVREDYTQELGLSGTILVAPSDPDYWAPANRELVLVLDDVLLKGARIAPFSRSGSTRTAMGRFGNVLLVNGETAYVMEASRGEVVRLYLLNTANVRPFNVRLPGARMKLVGGDGGRVERERFVEEVLIAPSERAVADVLFEQAGQFRLEHRTPDRVYTLGTVTVHEGPVERSYAREFSALRTSPELVAEWARLETDLARPPDKTLALVAEMPGMKGHGNHGGHGGGHGHAEPEAIEWEDTMALHNRMTTPENMFWKLVDRETGAENHAIRWSFRIGDRVKLRLVNDPHSDHPMQHPFHVHGERFLVLSRDSVPNDTLGWKDSVLVRTGETVDLLVEMSNPGTWMAHCHIAEHLEGGMMLSFRVDRE
jgi:FtsP/CotA-like multicopper oxidase with cupredoxin domain